MRAKVTSIVIVGGASDDIDLEYTLDSPYKAGAVWYAYEENVLADGTTYEKMINQPVQGMRLNIQTNVSNDIYIEYLQGGLNGGDETVGTIGDLIAGATAKTTPVDADYLPLMDSVASNVLKKLSWANVKVTLKAYFDTIYTTTSAVATQITTELSSYLPLAGGTMSGVLTTTSAINEAAEVTIASASSVAIGAAASNNIIISGTTPITSFDTVAAGIRRSCRATGAFKITYNATTLITVNGKDITTKANDTFEMLSLGSGNWIMLNFSPVDGRIMANGVNNQTGTTYTVAITDLGNDVTLSNASAITTTFPAANTFPIGSKFKFINLGAGLNTFAKTGADTLRGNTTLAQYQTAFAEITSATEIVISLGTTTVNLVGTHIVLDTITTSQTVTLVGYVGSACTMLGLYQKARALTTAGTFAIKKNGTSLTGLESVVPSTAGGYTTATGTGSDNVFARGDQITIVADGTLLAVLHLALSLDLTQAF